MAFHLIDVNEIFSNADGTVQFIELISLGPAETAIAGHSLTVTQGGTTHTFDDTTNLVGNTQGKTILFATQGFADLHPDIKPDFIIPDGFLFTSGSATVDWAGVDTLNYSDIPTDGIHSLNGNGVEQTASPAPYVSGNIANGTAGADTINGTGFADSLSGGDGNDTLVGGDGADTLAGGAGNDSLDGGAGVDSLRGGAGSDTYIATAGDKLVELAGQGIDTVRSGSSWTLGAQLDRLMLTGTAANGTGNALGNNLAGNGTANKLSGLGGNDTLVGGGGNDVLTGGAGADRLQGGAGNDLYSVGLGDIAIEALGAGTDTVNAGFNWTLGANLDNLRLIGAGDLTGTGNGIANVLRGNAGDNTLLGLAGADQLWGGAGNDTLTGGAGADEFVFDAALSGTTNVNRVTDFAAGTDRLVLPDNIFTAVTGGVSGTLTAAQFASGAGLSTAQDANDRIIYNTSTGALFYDADGTGATGAVRFAVLGTATHPAIDAADLVVLGV